jgi:hypothetical protein
MAILKNKKKTVGLEPKIYEDIKKYCKREGYIIQVFIEKIITEYLKNNR